MSRYLSAVAVQTGELVKPLEQIEQVESQFAAIKLPFNKILIGCDSYCATGLSPAQLLQQVMEKSLAATSLNPAKIDQLIVVSANPETLAMISTESMVAIQQQLGLVHARPMATTFEECTGLICAIDLAAALIANASSKHVLVASVDVTHTDADRVKAFGVRSDGAFAAIVSEQPVPGEQSPLKIVASHKGMDFSGYQGDDNLDNRQALVKGVLGPLLAKAEINSSQIDKVFSTNFYRPISAYNASAAGFANEQLYVESAKSFAHCVCGDPLLNLQHYFQTHSIRPSAYYLLQSYAPGFFATVLVQGC